MKVYAFDLLPWPYLDEPSYYPDPNALFDPARGREVYADHLDQMAMYEEYGFDAICMRNIELFAKTVLPALKQD